MDMMEEMMTMMMVGEFMGMAADPFAPKQKKTKKKKDDSDDGWESVDEKETEKPKGKDDDWETESD